MRQPRQVHSLKQRGNESLTREILEKRRNRLENEFANLADTVPLSPILFGSRLDLVLQKQDDRAQMKGRS